ncbi:hypothetical protein PIB30_095822 [Stylosanthes scabra]|uniref:Putative plant transposon protein domain-containing protein n=1 Tax=Stylosanthes scabra TaxID=79078 RepID=A0ABU6RWA0_9FABA|nr:hypothetical protein [Stylosanthes scabra]
MASSSSTTNMVDEHYFRALFNQNLFDEIVRRKKVTPVVNFELEDEEYPTIREQIALRGWRRLASPRTKISKLLIQEFYANAVQTEEEMEQAEQHPYKSYVRETYYATRQRTDQRLDEFLTDLCIPRATWRLSYGQPAQPIQLRRAELTPLARGWQEFIIYSIIPTGNKSEIIIARAEELTADNIAVIAQGMQGKGKLAFPSTIYKLCKDAHVPMHEFRRTELIPLDKPITARLMETTRLGRNVQVQQQQNEEEENQPIPQFKGGNEEDHDQGQHQHFEQQLQQPEAGFQQNYWEQQQRFHLINEQLVSMQLQQQQFFKNMQSTQA